MSAGRAPKEIIIKRAGQGEFSLFALTVDELKVWFVEMKRVSDVRFLLFMSCSRSSSLAGAFAVVS